MVQYVEINGTEYPFKFGMREIFEFSNKQNVEFDEVQGAIEVDFDLFLDLFHSASKKGAKKENNELVLSPEQLEEAIDDDPDVFERLQSAFQESQVVKKMQQMAKNQTSQAKQPDKSKQKKKSG